MVSDREIGRAYAALGARRALIEAEDAPLPDRRIDLWRSRLMGSMRPNEYAGTVQAGCAARDAILAEFARIDRKKAKEQQRIEAAMRAEFDPIAVAASMLRQPRVLEFNRSAKGGRAQ